VGPEVEEQGASLGEGDALVLENLRFYAEEEQNERGFAGRLARLGDVYVNDAFGAAHRAHASIEAITHYLTPAVAGLLMEKEIEYLSKALERPERPYVAIVGGAKVSDKIDLLQNLMKFADSVLIGGAMAYTFLKAQGADVGRSKVEADKLALARDLWQFCERRSIELHLPKDHVVADRIDASARAEVVHERDIPPNRMGVDIGPATRAQYAREIARAKMIVWNGPMGVFEIEQFAAGTLEIARAIAASSAVSIVGGGDSAAAVAKAGVGSKITHISTGGGASLEFLAGMKLPGVQALTDKE
jgi:phosphoglycerate kinase